MTDKEKAWHHALKTEWVMVGDHTIKTKDAFYVFWDYRNDGKLKKNAKKHRAQILFQYIAGYKHILEQICVEHNWFVNRDNKKALAQMLENEVKKTTYRLLHLISPEPQETK